MFAMQEEAVAAGVRDAVMHVVVELDGAHGAGDDDARVRAHLSACAGGRHEVSEGAAAASRDKPTNSQGNDEDYN